MKMVKKLVKVIKERNSENKTKIIFSDLIQKEDYDFPDKIGDNNSKLKKYFASSKLKKYFASKG